MDDRDYEQGDNGVRGIEQMFSNVLSPLEPLVMKIQSLLVWENPRKSAVMFLFIHGVFWFVAVYGLQFYFTISMVTLILYVTHTWKRKIWPEIRVPPPFPDDPDSWTPVHARLMSVPEICQKLAHLWLTAHNYINCWLAFRINHHFLFCVVNSSILILLAGLGRYISDFMLTYIIVISLLLWPCVLYNKLLSKFYLNAEPLLMKLDYSLKLKPQWIFKEKKSHKGTADFSFLSDKSRGDSAETDSDSDDFTPSPDPLAAALARAITDSEDEGGSITLGESPDVSTPRLSKEPSVDLNEEHINDGSDSEAEFALGISEMPSLDDVLDHTDDELLDTEPVDHDTLDIDVIDAHHGQMNFITTHFGDSDFEGETRDSFSQDLHIDDSGVLDDTSVTEKELTQSGRTETESESASTSSPVSLVSRTFTSVMGSALHGLSSLTQSAIGKSPVKQPADRVAYTSEGEVSVEGQSCVKVEHMAEGSDLDIEEEFEFLEEYDDQGDKTEK